MINIVGPLIYELNKDQAIEFHFLNGLHEAPSFPGLGNQYHGPFFQYYPRAVFDITSVILSMQALPASASTPEQFARQVYPLYPQDAESEAAIQHVMDFASNSELGPFDGLLGFSDGASVAASILINQERSSSFRPFKYAVLISSTLPLRPENEKPFLADEMGQIISTPTAHILGAKDPARRCGLALFNLCTDGTASLYEHGQGHEIPRLPATTKKMAELIREMFKRGGKEIQTGT